MDKWLFRLCQVYSFLLLLAIAIFTTPPYLIVSLVLLLALFFITLRRASPRLSLTLSLTTFFLLPLMLAPILQQLTSLAPVPIELLATVAALPILYLMDYHLRQNAAQLEIYSEEKESRRVTGTYRVLLATTLALMVIALMLDKRVLLTTGILLALYLLGVTVWIFFTLPRSPLDVTRTGQRVIAGATADIPVNIVSRTRGKVSCRLSPSEDWVKITEPKFTLERNTIRLTISCTPPLAGPTRPTVFAAITDARGLVQVNQTMEPVELHVIPQARYAEWLAKKYLEQTGAGVVAAATLPPQELALPRRGVEYQDSRTYQPGDQLKDIDWKHTLKLRQLIVKEFTEAGEQAAIIAVNLTVNNAEGADRLAFNLITAALTLAREHIPAALAVYDEREVRLTTNVTEPHEILRRTLSLVREISLTKPAHQYLEAPDIIRIRRNINQLKPVASDSAQRLREMLDFEHRAIEEIAREHPATAALTRVTRQITAPAVILLISQLNHDVEAVLMNREKLARRRFSMIPLLVTA